MTEEELQTRVIENLKFIRKSANLSQEKLADKADISRQMMNDIEGRRRWLTKSTLVKICNALNVDPFELFKPTLKESLNVNNTYNLVKDKIFIEVKNAIDNIFDELQ